MTKVAPTWGGKVEERRRALKLSQEELAELARVSVRFIRSLEHDKPSVRLDKVTDVLDVLGFEIDIQVRLR
ncbi:MAG: helix-turn-helix domain-containing protein [Actinomycetota bacterium]|nr:helix-turn-helix domain-containing protein [Actinomycetota bacterium]